MCVSLGFMALSDDDNYDAAERAVSQVVHQLRHLVNVWRNVLPGHIYAKALGELLLCLLVLFDMHRASSSSFAPWAQ